MGWIFSAFLFVSMIHMVEEYFYPGGFMDTIKRLNSRFARLVTVPMAVIINGLQLLLCIVAIVVWKSALIFSMSVAGLLFFNGLMHIMGSIRAKGYAPGIVSGVLLYIPLSAYAYSFFIGSGQLTPIGLVITGLLGLFYQAVPIGYFVLASAMRRA
jgi:Protein of unknown function with HXXEE motif